MSQQLILRVPDHLVSKIREHILHNYSGNDDLLTQIEPEEGDYFKFKFDQVEYPAMVSQYIFLT